EPIAPDQQRLAARIPQRESVHPLETRDEALPEVLVQMDQYLYVAPRLEAVTTSLERIAQRAEVVDLPVAHDPDGAVLVAHRLVPAAEVDDREPPHPDHGLIAVVYAVVVRAAMRDQVSHPQDVVRPVTTPAVNVGRTDDPAHR